MAGLTQQLTRQMVEKHFTALAEIDSDTIGEKWNRSHFEADLPSKWECSWLAVHGREPLGFVVASNKGESVHIHRVAVASASRGKGIGRILLEQVANSAKRLEIDRITLRVSAHNTGAVRFYYRLGFAQVEPGTELLTLSIPVDALLRTLHRSGSTAQSRCKVLFVCAADISAAKLLAPQVKALTESGFDVHIACSSGPYAQSLEQEGYQVRPLNIVNRASPLESLASILALYRLIRRERYHIVHVHMISAGFLGRIAAKLAGTPLILYTFRGFAFYEGSSRRLRWFNLAIEKACRPFTDFYFSQSEENWKRAIRHGVIPLERSMLLGNGIAVDSFTPEGSADRETVRHELGINGDVPVVGFVGRLVKEKGIFELVEAAADVLKTHPTTVFMLVGDALPTDESSALELRNRIKEQGIDSQFRITGWRSDVDRLYQAMDVFVLPSYREGMPRSTMEAMASGKPVVATNIAGCKDQVQDGVTGVLVPLGESQPLADAICTLLCDPAKAQRMGNAGRVRAMHEFDERRVCQRLVDRYLELTADIGCAGKKETYVERASLGVKRAIDLASAVVGLVVLLPLFVLVAIAIKIDSPGPVLYRQIREGRERSHFVIYKFRTMTKDADKRGLEIKRDDDRITRVGRLLRSSSLDELPQLLNVLRGDMSLVGPRPLLPGTTKREEERRLSMRPGITSYPALFGRHALSWEDRMPIDLWYVDNWSLKLDLRILLLTIPVVLSADNVYDPEGGSRMRSNLAEVSANGNSDTRL